MSNEIELFSDGDGVAIFGEPHEVELFLSAAGVPSKKLPPFSSALNVGSGVAQARSQITANSGRWVKLTEESAKALKLGKAMSGSSEGVSRAIATTSKGKITKVLEFVKPTSAGAMLTNPAMLAGAAGIMAQLAMQQTMDEITQYLQVIDAKVDDVLRAQSDAAIAEMIGVGRVIDDAILKREYVGRVSEVTWSSLHSSAQTIATTQAYALRRLEALVEKLGKSRKVGDLAKLLAGAKRDTEQWLAVLARCFQLQEGLAIMELDRVLDSSPEDLDRHREAIQVGRTRRRDLIATTTQHLLEQMEEAAKIANAQVLGHPVKAKVVVQSGNVVATDVVNFNKQLGIQQEQAMLEVRRWGEAVGEVRDTVAQAVEAGATATVRFSSESFMNVKSAGEGLSERVAKWLPRSQKDAAESDEDDAQYQER